MHKHNAFTIVELLIVIVVIGILAAIIIISYNGITQGATTSQLQANATEIAQKLSAYKIQTSASESYPPGTNSTNNLAMSTAISNLVSQASLPTNLSSSITAYLTDPNNKNFCATVTSGSTSYSVSSKSPSPIAGTCIENLVPNPGMHADSTYWVYSTGILNTPNRTVESGGLVYYWSSSRATTDAGGFYINRDTPIPVVSNTDYTAYLEVGGPVGASLKLRVADSGTTNQLFVTTVSVPSGNNSADPVYTTGSTGSSTSVNIALISSTGSVGDTYKARRAMLVSGDARYQWGDGSSPGWFWEGDANNSASIGPSIAQ